MAETPLTSAQQAPVPIRDAEAIAVEQEKLDPRVMDYIHALTAANGAFSEQITTDRRLFAGVLAQRLPKIPGREADGQALRRLIEDIVGALPTVDTMPTVQADISIAAGRLAPDILPEPNGRAVIGSFDGAEGVLRQCALPPMDELPSLDYMAVPTGLVVIVQLVPKPVDHYAKAWGLDFGSGENLYSERNRDKPLRYEDPVVPYIANPAPPLPIHPEDVRIRKAKEAQDKREAEEDEEAALLLAARKNASAKPQTGIPGQQGLSAEQLSNASFFAKKAREQQSEINEMAAIEYEHPAAAILVNDREEWPGAVELVELETLVGWELTGRGSKDELGLEADAIPETSLSNEITVGLHQDTGHAAIVEGAGFFAPAEAEAAAGEESGAAAEATEGFGAEDNEIPGQSEEAKILAAEAVPEASGGTAEAPETEEVAAEEAALSETGGTEEAELAAAGVEAAEAGEEPGPEPEIEPGETARVEEEGNERRWLFAEGVEQQDERKEDNTRAEGVERAEENNERYSEERRDEREEFRFETEQRGERREEREERREDRFEAREEGERRPERNEETELEEPRQLGREQREDIRERLEQPERQAERRIEERQSEGVEERREERQEFRDERREDGREQPKTREAAPVERVKEQIKEEVKEQIKEEAAHHLQHEDLPGGLEEVVHRHGEEPLHEHAYHRLEETHEALREEQTHELGRQQREDLIDRQSVARDRGDERRRDKDIASEAAYHAIQETHRAAETGGARYTESSDIPTEPARPAAQPIREESPSPMGDEIHEAVQSVQPSSHEDTREHLMRDTAMHVLAEHGIPGALAHHDDVRDLAEAGGWKSALSLSLAQVGKAVKKTYKIALKKRQAPPPAPPKAEPQPALQKTAQADIRPKAHMDVRHPYPKMGDDGME